MAAIRQHTMMTMKIYIISNDPRIAIFVSNIVNQSGHTGIVSELRGDDPKEQLNDLKMNMDGADAAVVMCSNPKLLAIAANKMSGMRAVACKDEEDAQEAASDAGANIISIDDNKNTRAQIASIMNGWLGSNYHPKQKQQQAPQRVPAQQEYEHDQQWSAPAGGGVGGMMDSFKSMLGLGEGAEEAPQPKRQQQQQKQKAPMHMPKIHVPKVKMPKLNLKSVKESLGITDD